MHQYVQKFSSQIKEAIAIAQRAELKNFDHKIANVVICGIGGSGIGGKLVSNLFEGESKIPVTTCNEYDLPAFVNEQTLCIMSSYSGNTEEVLSMLEQAMQAKAEIACITSGGKILEIAKSKGYNLIVIPGGNPPRSCLGYSLVQQIRLLLHYGVVKGKALEEITQSALYLDQLEEEIVKDASAYAKQLSGKIPVVYSSGTYSAIAARFCQQLNENSKVLCWHNKFPELNHNEIVGWTQVNPMLAPIFIQDQDDFYRTKTRISFTIGVVKKYTDTVLQIEVKGNNPIEKAIYLIHLTDWISVKIAEVNGTDPIEIEVIDALKKELSTLQ